MATGMQRPITSTIAIYVPARSIVCPYAHLWHPSLHHDTHKRGSRYDERCRRGGSLFIGGDTPGGGRLADMALEGAIEGDGRLIAHALRDLGQIEIAML